MKKILLLTTGGTIASEPTENGLAPAGDVFTEIYDYKRVYRRLYSEINAENPVSDTPKNRFGMSDDTDEEYDIRVKEILNTDSSNIMPDQWGKIAESIYEGLTDDAEYDGIVVTHGTDTMAYTLAAMPYFLKKVNKPVIFTGSQIPMGMPDSDAEKNLTDAVTAAASGCSGIFLVFAGKIIDCRYAKKVHAKEKDAFESINHADAGYIAGDGSAYFSDQYKLRIEISGSDYRDDSDETETAVCGREGCIFRDIKPDSLIACIKLLPGQNADMLDFLIEKGYHAVILEAFGYGGIPDNETGWLSAIERAVKAGVTVYVQSQCTYDGTDLSVYEVGQKALKAGALCAEDMTTEALCVKLMLGL